ncbi:hypothetical protein F4819DRAFT_81686 [Hypoxylon fuscum]|nr:hypothetical protein F4819DRAFT_81686 [Hypoxylon fuscum]
MTFLHTLWATVEVNRCCHCGNIIAPEDVLARTFAIQGQHTITDKNNPEKPNISSLYDKIQVFHRHVKCLFESVNYVAVSHVWHPRVAELQRNGENSAANVDEVSRLIQEESIRIYFGLARSLEGPFEVWYDYISVPQWQKRWKDDIISAIPDIFTKARLTVVCLADVARTVIENMREGHDIGDRMRGISSICNSKWLGRIWTAMEFTLSTEVRVMLSDHMVVRNNDTYSTLLHELNGIWQQEVNHRTSSHQVKDIVDLKSSLVPWQLGPLFTTYNLKRQGIRIEYSHAYEMLTWRHVTIPRDFFHAFLGLLDIDLTEKQLSNDNREAMLQIARCCMARGDYSPLFMIPESSQKQYSRSIVPCGYLGTYSLGGLTIPPTVEHIAFRSGNPVITAEKIGVVNLVRKVDWVGPDPDHPMELFSVLAKLCLDFVGMDVYAFVNTLGGRIYGQALQRILAHLSEGNRVSVLRSHLQELYDAEPNEVRRDITDAIARIMGLSGKPMEGFCGTKLDAVQYMNTHGHTMHRGRSAALASIQCSTCHEQFLISVALLLPASEVLGAVAFRVPGLKYAFSHEGGMGMLLRDGQMVGRFIWGTPNCSCSQAEDVTIRLDGLPLPKCIT